MHHTPPPAHPETPARTRLPGIALIVFAALSAGVMLLHPTTGTHDHAEFVARSAGSAHSFALIHGILLSLLLLSSTCLLALRDRLGPNRLLVRFGLTALLLGTAGAVAAALINGFIIPNLTVKFAHATPEELSALQPCLALAREVGATFARLSIFGLSLCTTAWSLRLLAFPGSRRIIAALALVCGLVPLALHAAEHLHINVAGYTLFAFINAAWYTLAGITLLRWNNTP